jgi:hypothetical protein
MMKITFWRLIAPEKIHQKYGSHNSNDKKNSESGAPSPENGRPPSSPGFDDRLRLGRMAVSSDVERLK